MKIGFIGLGVVGGALYKWMEKNTSHQLLRRDPAKGYEDELMTCHAVFIAIPVLHNKTGQDISELKQVVKYAKQCSNHVFIRSSVLPGTSDELGCYAIPEFLTERIADSEMDRLPIIVGDADKTFVESIFEGKKKIIAMKNKEAEMSKYAHNCMGAVKVTYCNVIKELCEKENLDYERVKEGFLMTGFVNETHTQVPGPDKKYGYGGSCFPTNIKAFKRYIANLKIVDSAYFLNSVQELNDRFRRKL